LTGTPLDCPNQTSIVASGGLGVCDGAHWLGVMKKLSAQYTVGQFTFLDFRENPKLHAAVESHPNVEKHDVRMGHPAPATI
jgi:hypothetical protein